MLRHSYLLPILLGFASFATTLLRAQPAAPEKPAADAPTVKKLIEELGADEFATREAATEQLARIGLPAYKAVEGAVQHPDREVRYRAERVLGRIRQTDLQRRLDAFIAGKEATDDYQLPGWTRFKKAFGDAESSRKNFVDLTKADPEMLQTLESNPKNVAELFGVRIQQNQQLAQFGGGGNTQLGYGQVAMLVFVAGEEDVSLNQNHNSVVFNYCSQANFADAITGSSRGDVPRKMLSRLILKSEDFAAYSAMSLARRFNMKEGLTCAEKILKANRQPHMASMALMTIAAMGDESHLPQIEKLFADTNLVTQMQEREKVMIKVEVRDSALAAALFLTKQDLKSYYTIPAGQAFSDPQMVLTNARIIGHSDEAKRAEVFKKWTDYRAKNPGPVEKKDDKAEEKPTADKPAEKAVDKNAADTVEKK
ncbi:HEAT repeat domain-containing protein [Anatilimnocola floriformis]|uniref:HEAT repeat domain-containing protein n=1 Tax=Anatilimnocola floriformis TaxID=2948575 RepID=UPI0020C20351|nr:HEAT repeat domain-containing protein [Anatilimnocola floriformis]